MAKLARVFHKVFGSAPGATDMGQFGSFTAGTPAYSSDPATIMALAAWATGWLAATVSGTEGTSDPFLEDRNAVDFVHSRQIGYILQQGVPEYDPLTSYYSGSFCTYQGVLFQCIQDGNSGNLPPLSTAWWIPYDPSPVGTVRTFAGILVPFGYLVCDGSAKSRTTYSNLFNARTVQTTGNTVSGSPIVSGMGSTANMQAGFAVSGPGIPASAFIGSVDSASQIHLVNGAGAALNATATAAGVAVVASPGGLGDGSTTFNLPDYRGRTIIGAGAGSGLTARTQGQIIGEENHQLSIGEMPSHNHALTDPTHSHTPKYGGYFYATGAHASEVSLQSGGVFGADYTTEDRVAASGTGITLAATGGGAVHNNMQPSAVEQYIIKY